MQYKKLGRTGLKVSEVCLGTMSFGYPMEEADAIRMMKHAYEKGINFVDTAQYNSGKAEEIVGQGLKGERDKWIVCTKFSAKIGPDAFLGGSSRKNIIASLERSLRILNTDYIDVYFQHYPDYNTPWEETLRTMDDLIRQGKIRYAACCNLRAFQLIKSLWVSDKYNLTRFEVIQVPLNILTRDIEYELLPACAEEQIGVMSFNPTAAGLLTGLFDLRKPPLPGSRFAAAGIGDSYKERYWNEANFKAIEELKKQAAKKGISLVQFAMAWTMKHPGTNIQLMAADNIVQFDENLAALNVEITKEDRDLCDRLWKTLSPPRFMYGR